MQRRRRNQLFLVLFTSSLYLSFIRAQIGCVPTDFCMSSSNYGSQQYRCKNGKAVLIPFYDDNCTEIAPGGYNTNYTCSPSAPCTDYIHVRVYEGPQETEEPYPTWSDPTNTDENSCGTFIGATTAEYEIDFYNFTVTNYSTIIIDSCGSTFDTYLYFLSADGRVISECDDCGDCDIQSILTVDNVAPGQYQIGIGGFESFYGQYAVTVYCEDDDFLPQTTYDGPDNTYPNPTWSFPTDLYPTWSWPDNTEEGSCGTFYGATSRAYDVDYYDFTVTNYSTIIINSCGSAYDTYLYFETTDGIIIEECDDCGDCGVQTILTVNNVAPGEYQIGIGGYSDDYGRYAVTVYCEDAIFIPQTTDNYPDDTDTDTDTNWYFDPTPDDTYALDEDICDSEVYQEIILPVGCQQIDVGYSEYRMCSLHGITIYAYLNNDCSGQPYVERTFLDGCHVDEYGYTLKLDIIQCMRGFDVDTTSTTERTETTENDGDIDEVDLSSTMESDEVVTEEEDIETTEELSTTLDNDDTVDGDGVDGIRWKIATGVMMAIMIFLSK